MLGDLSIIKATIASGGTTSGAVDCRGHQLVGIEMPGDFTGVALSFLSSRLEDGTFQAVTDSAGNAVSLTVAADRHVVFDGDTLSKLLGLGWTKVVSGSAEGAARDLYLYLLAHR